MFIELHSRSAFSFLEGASLPEDLIAMCAHLNMPAMALLDRDGVYGAPRFYMAAKKAKIKAHMGAEVTCEFSHEFQIDEIERSQTADCFTNLRSEILEYLQSFPPSPSRLFPRRLPESLPPDHKDETARTEEG